MLSHSDILLRLAVHGNRTDGQLRTQCERMLKEADVRYHPFIKGLMNAKSPIEALGRAWIEMDRIKDQMARLLADGYHGMVVFGNQEHGLKLLYDTPDTLQWARENEVAVNYQVTEQTMRELGVQYGTFETVLFEDVGFSGKGHRWQLAQGLDGKSIVNVGVKK